MFKDRMPNNRFDLNLSFSQLTLAISTAISSNIPKPLNINPTDAQKFPTLHHDLYKIALEGPYGVVIRQIFDQIFMLITMQQMLLKVSERIQVLEKIISEKEKEDDEFFQDETDTYIPLTAELVSPEDELKKLKVEQDNLTSTLPKYQNRMLMINRVYLSAISNFLRVVATNSILNRAKQLNYDFNSTEMNALLNPVPREKIHSVLLASYTAALSPSEKGSSIKPHEIENELATQLANRAALDSQLNLVMVISQYRDRNLEEIESNLMKKFPELTPEEKMNKMAELRAEFDRKHMDPKLRQTNSTVDPTDPRTRFVRQARQENLPTNSVLAATKLVKSFKSTFDSLEQQLQALHELHKKQLSPEGMIEEMNRHIESAKTKLNPTAPIPRP